MKWEIADHLRVEIHAFTGLNLSGNRSVAQIYPAGGRQGDEIEGERIRSVAIAGLPGTRVVFCTTIDDEHWTERPWRAVVVGPDWGFGTKGGLRGVRIPDLDLLAEPTARRGDPDFEMGFDLADSLEDGRGWSYGNPGKLQMNIRCIRIDRVEL